MENSKIKPGVEPGNWVSLLLIVFLSTFAYGAMEWLFMVTKPSFLDIFSWGDKLVALLFAGTLTSLLGAFFILLLFLSSRIYPFRRIEGWLIQLGVLLPAGVIAAMLLLWIDNFTYTIFKFGIVSTNGIWRGAYALLFLLLIFLCWREIRRLLPILGQAVSKGKSNRGWILKAFFAIEILALGLSIIPILQMQTKTDIDLGTGAASTKPNIIMITSDGVNATNLSLYGYERDTTPFLKELAKTSLVAQNAFANASTTAGSTLSMYTGKSPATTRVIFPPNILIGSNAYQHLPGMLHAAGYRTVQIAIPHFADAYTLNLQNGFDFANHQTQSENALMARLKKHLPYHFAYFFYETGNRITDRLRHIFYLKKMENAFEEVTQTSKGYSDPSRIHELIQEIRSAQQPLFVHVHLVVTHGDLFNTKHLVFSKGKTDQKPWDTDFYDDAILDMDQMVKQVFEELDNDGLINNTIMIVGSDHGQKWSVSDRIPMLFHFPNGQYAGVTEGNVQIIDIAPTILDYIGLKIPTWMEGQSILKASERTRPIFSVSSIYASDRWNLNKDMMKPPFYQFQTVNLVYCQKWYRLNLGNRQFTSGIVRGYVSPCPEPDLLDNQRAISMMSKFLEQRGFNVSSLQGKVSAIK